MPKKFNLLSEEKEIENSIDDLIPVSKEKEKKIKEIISKAKKGKMISLRISENDLIKLKMKASEEGIPYQTLIGSIIHKYVNEQLADKNDMIRILDWMKQRKTS